MTGLLGLLLLTFLGIVAGLLGGAVIIARPKWSKLLCEGAVPFAAGVLLTVAFLDVIPEAVEGAGEVAYTIVLFSIIGAFLFEQFFTHLHHHDDRSHTKKHSSSIPLVLIGDTIHNLVDGVAIGAAYLVDPMFGLVVAISTFLHETPHEIGDFGILVNAGWSRSEALMTNLASSLAAIPGALFVYFFIGNHEPMVGAMLAVSAGLFVYLGASDFMPQIEGNDDKVVRKTLILLFGVVVMYVFLTVVPHGEGGEHGDSVRDEERSVENLEINF